LPFVIYLLLIYRKLQDITGHRVVLYWEPVGEWNSHVTDDVTQSCDIIVATYCNKQNFIMSPTGFSTVCVQQPQSVLQSRHRVLTVKIKCLTMDLMTPVVSFVNYSADILRNFNT